MSGIADTPPYPGDPNWDQWKQDFYQGPNSFMNGAAKNQQDTTDYGTDKTNFETKMGDFAHSHFHTPEEMLLYFFAFIATCTDPNQRDNILGLYDDQTTIYGDQMTANARMTKLTNDIQGLLNDTVSTDQVPLKQQVPVARLAIGQLIWKLQNDPSVNKNLFDPSTINSIVTQLQTIKTTLDVDFNPDVPAYDPSKPTQYYSPTQMQSFDDMKNRMSIKSDTSPNLALTAAKSFTDAAQVLTSLTQNVSAVLNQRISQSTGMDKNWQSFVGSLMKSLLDELGAITQNLSKG